MGGGPLEAVLSSAVVLRKEADTNISILIGTSVLTHLSAVSLKPFSGFPLGGE